MLKQDGLSSVLSFATIGFSFLLAFLSSMTVTFAKQNILFIIFLVLTIITIVVISIVIKKIEKKHSKFREHYANLNGY
ncbi:hypothetical protein [Oceanobacillus sojae]|uniref:hypothetical protein n=1 Tax=Oceanobacillus sojae TaxID=582851 RepID=UPI0009886F66|nr:hypothetical protein [Oceanobacillus sojae]